MKTALKWKRATPILPSNHIISSKAQELGILGFSPEYEKERYKMGYLLSNEYMRLWFKERALYQKENYAKQENTKFEPNLKRGFVQRMMTNPKAKGRELPIIELRQFQNIVSKVDTGLTKEEKARLCERYRASMLPTELERYKPACPNKKTQLEKKLDKLTPRQRKQFEKSTAKQHPNQSKPKEVGNHPHQHKCQFVCKLINVK